MGLDNVEMIMEGRYSGGPWERYLGILEQESGIR